MAVYQHLKKQEQEFMPLFNGAFIENKPIAFPNFEGTTAYSNLFYWAHLEALETSEFPLHPHEGFEIVTFVFDGSVEHYDTATRSWTPLKEGDVQVIQAGSGVEHAERIVKGTRLFQIWFDPGFSKSLLKKASYKDYKKESFFTQSQEGVQCLEYVGPNSSLEHETQGLEITKSTYASGSYTQAKDKDFVYSYYLLEGKIQLNGIVLEKDDFLVEEEVDTLELEVLEGAELFMIKSPQKVDYQRFIQRY